MLSSPHALDTGAAGEMVEVAVTGTTPSPMGLVKVLISLTTKGAKQVVVGCIPMRAVTTSPPVPTLKRGTV